MLCRVSVKRERERERKKQQKRGRRYQGVEGGKEGREGGLTTGQAMMEGKRGVCALF